MRWNLVCLGVLAVSGAEFNHALNSNSGDPSTNKRPVNILMILADDLGYGDTSVHPFTGTGIMTPELEKMAARGTVMTNFHTAAATCTPTRTSILTGMYPWRNGVKAVYEYGFPTSNRNDWLPLLPTSAMTFRDASYLAGHSGKWHMGGMRNDDLDMRHRPSDYHDSENKFVPKCPHPGPNQQGFEEYVSVLDGPGAPRQNELQTQAILYSKGCTALLRNDVHIGRKNGTNDEDLSACEARHAIRMMRESVDAGRPFFIQLWFHAPHGPWEELPGYKHLYPDLSSKSLQELPACKDNLTAAICRSGTGDAAKRVTRPRVILSKYKTMVSSMDRSIGTVLDSLRTMGIEENTLVIFTSDNGPENMTPGDPAGTAGVLRGVKRHIHEGGIRVPSIWQWVGTIPAGKNTSTFGITTDLYPTFLEAAELTAPSSVRLDGRSLIPLLTSRTRVKKKAAKKELGERIAMWHNDYEGPKASALWIYDFKILLDAKEVPVEMFDMRTDYREKHNLLDAKTTLPIHRNEMRRLSNNYTVKINIPAVRADPVLHRWILSRTVSLLYDFAKYGNEAHVLYLNANQGRKYTPTVESDMRTSIQNPYKFITKAASVLMRKSLINSTCGSTSCSCDIPSASLTPSLPFELVAVEHRRISPGGVPDASALLTLVPSKSRGKKRKMSTQAQ